MQVIYYIISLSIKASGLYVKIPLYIKMIDNLIKLREVGLGLVSF